MRVLGVTILSLGMVQVACARDDLPRPASDFDVSHLQDCVFASNSIQQEAYTTEKRVTSPILRRDDFLLRDEWLRRLAEADNPENLVSRGMNSDFVVKMSGNLNDFDYVAASNEQLSKCGDLLASLRQRMLLELKNGDD